MVWGSVEICYVGLDHEPHVSIRVAVPALDTQSDEQRRAEILKEARRLIDHACGAIEPADASTPLPDVIDGLAQELGLLPPRVSPNSQ